jgi:hypothetical protein
VRSPFPFIISILAATVLYSTTVGGVRAQTAETLSQVKKVYVTSLGGKQGAAELRDKLILRLKKCPGIEVVGSSSEADAILTGTGETWQTGYINTSPKPSPYSRQPVYDGYLSVELHGKAGTLLWSYIARPGKFQWNDVPQDLVNRTAKNLLAAMHNTRGMRVSSLSMQSYSRVQSVAEGFWEGLCVPIVWKSHGMQTNRIGW